MKFSKTKFIFLTPPCDAPDITKDFINELLKNLNIDNDCLISLNNRNIQPLIGFYNIS